MTYTLYGAEVSYYTGKARAFLNWKGVDFSETVASRDIYQNLIVPRIGWPVIPVVTGPQDEILQDTSDIIDTLDARLGGPSVFPESPVQRLVALLFELLGDEWLVIPAMHYRWNYNRDFAYSEFGRLNAPGATSEEQFEIGRKMAVNFEGALPVLGVDDETIPAIETAYIELLQQLDAHFSVHPMLLGDRPSIGDFGLYGPLYAHLYRDPASGDIMREHAPNVVKWVESLRDNTAAKPGEFLAGDEIPETLLPILHDQFRDQFPVLMNTAIELSKWAEGQPAGAPVPRALGRHTFSIQGTTGQRMIFPFNLWMLQRVLDQYNAMSDDDRAHVDALLSPIGGAALFVFPSFPRLKRQDYKLALA